LVGSSPCGRTPSGIDKYDPDIGELANAIEEMLDASRRTRLSEGACLRRDELSWETTSRQFVKLVEA
jgi:glycosyltransferase involved in cell wall biosynthesis